MPHDFREPLWSIGGDASIPSSCNHRARSAEFTVQTHEYIESVRCHPAYAARDR